MKPEKPAKKENTKKPASSKKKKKGQLHDVPMTAPRLERCIWIVNELQRHKTEGLTLKDIMKNYKEYLDEKYDGRPDLREKAKDDFNRRTFLHDKEAIKAMFNLRVFCDDSCGYKYFLVDDVNDKIARWMINSFATNEALLRNHTIQDRILLEDIPSNEKYLEEVLAAMRNNKKISFKYKNYNDARPTLIQHADPYCVKLYEKRWYVVVKEYATNPETNDTQTEKNVYCLDRFQTYNTEEESFTMEEGFSAEAFFYNAFAVRVEKDAPVYTVKLKVASVQIGYFEHLKLHHSQTIENKGDYYIVTLRVALTVELVMKLLYYGPLVEVMEPDVLREEMAYNTYWMAKAYGVDQDIVDEYLDKMEEDSEGKD